MAIAPIHALPICPVLAQRALNCALHDWFGGPAYLAITSDEHLADAIHETEYPFLLDRSKSVAANALNS